MNNSNKKKTPSIFMQEVMRDIATFRRLPWKNRFQFLWDYYRYKIIAAITIVIIVAGAANLLYQGQKPCRLRVCAVLNTNENCSSWFKPFFKELAADGNKAACDLNLDQPFDYDNKYYYVQELEVMTTISSQRMDVAICGPDMYEYVLSLNACLPLDTIPELEGCTLVESTAGVRYNDDGTLDETDAVTGFFAIDISDSAFGQEYNENQDLEEGEEKAPLYALIISNTDHLEDSVTLLKELNK